MYRREWHLRDWLAEQGARVELAEHWQEVVWQVRADPRVAFHRLPDSCCLPPPNELRKHCPPQQSTSCRLDFVLRALCLTGSSFFPVLRINWVWLADWTLPCQYVHACVATSLCKHGGIQPKLPTWKLMELIWRFPHSAQCRLYLAFHGSYSVFLSALFWGAMWG